MNVRIAFFSCCPHPCTEQAQADLLEVWETELCAHEGATLIDGMHQIIPLHLNRLRICACTQVLGGVFSHTQTHRHTDTHTLSPFNRRLLPVALAHQPETLIALALLTRISMPPNFFTVASIAARTLSSLRMSPSRMHANEHACQSRVRGMVSECENEHTHTHVCA